MLCSIHIVIFYFYIYLYLNLLVVKTQSPVSCFCNVLIRVCKAVLNNKQLWVITSTFRTYFFGNSNSNYGTEQSYTDQRFKRKEFSSKQKGNFNGKGNMGINL